MKIHYCYNGWAGAAAAGNHTTPARLAPPPLALDKMPGRPRTTDQARSWPSGDLAPRVAQGAAPRTAKLDPQSVVAQPLPARHRQM